MQILNNLIGIAKGWLEQSTWDIQVQTKTQEELPSNKTIAGIIKVVTQTVKMVQNLASGLFFGTEDGYEKIAEFDSFISLNGTHDSEIVKNVIENGSFRSVNKIKSPDKVVIELAKGGYKGGIENVLAQLKRYEGSTNLCKIVTPFGQMKDLNIIRLEYNYSQDEGANMLIAKITLQEVVGGRVGPAKYTVQTTASPSNTNTDQSGRIALKG